MSKNDEKPPKDVLRNYIKCYSAQKLQLISTEIRIRESNSPIQNGLSKIRNAGGKRSWRPSLWKVMLYFGGWGEGGWKVSLLLTDENKQNWTKRITCLNKQSEFDACKLGRLSIRLHWYGVVLFQNENAQSWCNDKTLNFIGNNVVGGSTT